MKEKQKSKLRFNFGHLLQGDRGGRRDVELLYPKVRVSEDVTLAPLEGKFKATRTGRGIYLKGTLHSVIETECTRCLDAVALPIAIALDDLFYYPPSAAPDGEYAISEDGILDLSPLVRELSLLEIPMQVYCRENCLGICTQCGQNLNEGECECVLEEPDPRWDALRALKNE